MGWAWPHISVTCNIVEGIINHFKMFKKRKRKRYSFTVVIKTLLKRSSIVVGVGPYYHHRSYLMHIRQVVMSYKKSYWMDQSFLYGKGTIPLRKWNFFFFWLWKWNIWLLWLARSLQFHEINNLFEIKSDKDKYWRGENNVAFTQMGQMWLCHVTQFIS